MCNECPAVKCEEGYCGICKFRKLEELFPAEFRLWVENLMRLHGWRKAGYTIGEHELEFEDWQALAVITRWFEVKDIEAAMPREPA